MSDLITYDDKIRLKSQNVSEKYKVTAGDMNEIKSVVNTNVELVDEINKPENWVSVGTEEPTDGRKVWFANSTNLMPNKLTSTTINGLTIVVGDDKSITINGTTNATTNIDLTDVFNLESGSYIISTNKEGTLDQSAYFLVLDANAGTELSSLNLASASEKTFTLNSNTSVKTRIYISTDRTFTNFKIYPMINEGTTATTYEPYIEKSINVDNEDFISMSDLVSVGINQPSDGKRVWFSKSKNLFDNNVERKSAYVSNPGSTGQVVAYNNSGATYSFVNCCKVEQGKTYTISWTQSQTPLSANSRQGCIVDNDNIVRQNVGTWFNAVSYSTFTANSNGFLILCTDIYATNIQIEEGSTATTYKPYTEPSIYVDDEQWYSKPIVLWQNADTTQDFESGSITLNDSLENYRYYEVIVKQHKTLGRYYSTGKIPTDKYAVLFSALHINSIRPVTAINNTNKTISFDNSAEFTTYNNANSTINNARNIPFQIIGYKE